MNDIKHVCSIINNNDLFLVATSIFDNCDIRKDPYMNGITKLKVIVNMENCKIIIIENDGSRSTFLESLNCIVFYTNNHVNENK